PPPPPPPPPPPLRPPPPPWPPPPPKAPVPPPPVPPPAPPAVPAPPAPPAPVSQSIEHSIHDSTGNWIWSNNGEKLQVSYSGTFEFTDDDADVKSASSGGYIKISDGAWFGRHSVEIRERNGQLERHYYVSGSEKPYEPEGRQWLHDHLPKF